jgi:hypothetical protein
VTVAAALLLSWSMTVAATAVPDAGAPDALEATRDAGDGPTGDTSTASPAAIWPAVPEPAGPAVVVPGQLFARGSRDPIGGATIVVDGLVLAETDAEGRFALVLSPGRRILQIQHPGYQPLTRFVQAGPGMATLELRLSAAEGATPRYETVIRAAAEQEQGPKRTLSRTEITKTAGSFGDPFRVIESLPGVATMMWPLPIYAVRGANPGNTGYYIDGVRVPALFHFALGPAVIHPYFLESLDFYSGGYPARHGRYVSGIISAATAAPPADRVRGSIDLRLFDAGGLVSSPIDEGRGTVAVAARYAYPAGLVTALVEEVRFHYWDYQARIDHQLGPGRLTLNAMGSYDLLAERAERISRGPDGEITVQPAGEEALRLLFHRLDVRWRGTAGGGRLSAGLALGLDRTEVPFSSDNQVAARARSLTPRVSYQRTLRPQLELETGLDGELTRFDGLLARPLPMVRLASLATSRVSALLGAHGSLVYRLHDRLVVSPGLRLDFFKDGPGTAFDLGPRLSLRLRAAESVWLKVSGGRASQLPSFPFQLPGIESGGLDRHGLQTAWQGGLGVEAAVRGIEVDATSFVQRYVLTDIRDPEFGDPLLDDFLIRRDGLSYGLELMLRRPPGEPLYGWLAYTLSRSLRAFEGGVVGPSDWDQRHVLNLVLGYRWGRTTLGGRFHLHTGRLVQLRNVSPLEMSRLPAFHQLDLRIERRFIHDRWVLDAYLELVNATLTRQVVSLYVDQHGVQEDGFRIVLPSLGLRAEF